MKQSDVILPPESRRTKSRRILLSPGEEIGEHVTENREEIIVVLKGTATVVVDGKPFLVNEKGHHYIGEGIRHNVMNRSSDDIEYIYIVNLFSNQ